MASTLAQLALLISDSVQAIDSHCATTGLDVPSLDAPFHPSSEAFRMDRIVSEAINIISIAANQLNAILQPPHVSAMQISLGHYQSAAMHALLEGNTVEILREAGTQGLHVDEISSKNGIDSKKQARLLRYLATKLVFREVRPDTFANNRISSVFDTGKSTDTLRLSPTERNVGFNAIINHGLVEGMLATSCLSENLLDSLTAYSEEPTASPWNRSTGATVPYWSYIQQSGQETRLQRFSNAMRGVASMLPRDDILHGFDWTNLRAGDIVVDVGSGVGATSLVLAKAHPQINIILQDEQPILDEAMRVWNTEFQSAIESDRVRMQAHDFFTDQPVKNASVFLLKNIIHDWSDSYAKNILTRLRDVATSDTRLLLVESLIEYACKLSQLDVDDPTQIPGASPSQAPEPLLANFGDINIMQYITDVSMLLLHNSQERTIGHFVNLLGESGWKIRKVYRPSGSFLQQIEAVPI